MITLNTRYQTLERCFDCRHKATVDEPMLEEIEFDVDKNKERVVIVCPKCNQGTYKED